MPDVTAAITVTVQAYVWEQAYRGGIEDPHLYSPTELLAVRSWPPEMLAAIIQLADLRAGRITCVRVEI